MLDADLPLAIDVMCDLVVDSVLAEADVETERGVILEEIAMHDDEPGDEVHDLFAEAIYGDHPLGRLISGTVDTISPMTRRQIQTFYHRRYTPPSMVVAAAGNLDHGAGGPAGQGGVRPVRSPRCAPASPSRRRAHRPAGRRTVRGAARLRVQDKDTEQAHLVLGGAGHRPRRRAALRAGRAQQRARRRHVVPAVPGDPGEAGPGLLGLLVHLQYADSGLFGVYAGCAPGKVDEVLALTREELAAGRRGTASPTRRSPGARACSRARWCWAWRTPARGCPGWARASCSTTSC